MARGGDRLLRWRRVLSALLVVGWLGGAAPPGPAAATAGIRPIPAAPSADMAGAIAPGAVSAGPPPAAHRIPLWVKVSYTLLVAVVVVVYTLAYGPANFLWFSDVALILTVPALWLESRFLTSMLAVMVLLPELFWNVSFFTRLLTGAKLGGLVEYMWDREKPLALRALSLFHVVVPTILVWMLLRLGYDPRAWIAAAAFGWIVLLATYALTDPAKNINWVFGLGRHPATRGAPLRYLAAEMAFFLVFVFLPTHGLLLWLVAS